MTNERNKFAFKKTTRSYFDRHVIPIVLKRDEYKCVNCGSKENLDVSHNRYADDITINDLETLCRSCHKKKDYEEGLFVKKQ